jgi:hypothetical protein
MKITSKTFPTNYLICFRIITTLLTLVLFNSCRVYSQNNNGEVYAVIRDFFGELNEPFLLDLKPQEHKTRGIEFSKILLPDIYDHNPYMDVPINSLLTAEDFRLMAKQLTRSGKVIRWDKSALEKYNISFINTDDSTQLSSDALLLKVTIPLFSKDGKTALLYSEHYRGRGVGGGSVAFMRKQPNGKWKMVSSIPIWIS